MKKTTMPRTTMPKTTDDPSDSASPHAHAPDLFLLSLVHDVTTALISARICYPLSYLLPVRDSAGSRARSISLHLKDLSILGMDGRGGVHDSHLDWVDGSIALEFWGELVGQVAYGWNHRWSYRTLSFCFISRSRRSLENTRIPPFSVRTSTFPAFFPSSCEYLFCHYILFSITTLQRRSLCLPKPFKHSTLSEQARGILPLLLYLLKFSLRGWVRTSHDGYGGV